MHVGASYGLAKYPIRPSSRGLRLAMETAGGGSDGGADGDVGVDAATTTRAGVEYALRRMG